LDDDRQRRLQAQRRVDGHHRGVAGVDGVDDFGAVDALQVARGDSRLVGELALDDDERNAFAGHLDGVRVAKLMWRKPAANAGPGGGVAKLGTCSAC
jgi:hypothetical protein